MEQNQYRDNNVYTIMETNKQIFLKTIIPSRKATKQYFSEAKKREDYDGKL